MGYPGMMVDKKGVGAREREEHWRAKTDTESTPERGRKTANDVRREKAKQKIGGGRSECEIIICINANF